MHPDNHGTGLLTPRWYQTEVGLWGQEGLIPVVPFLAWDNSTPAGLLMDEEFSDSLIPVLACALHLGMLACLLDTISDINSGW